MKHFISISISLFLMSCGGDDVGDSQINAGTPLSSGSSQILFDDIGNSNRLLTCNEASLSMQQAAFSLGVTDAQVRASVGKPRHIDPDGIVWRFGDDREPIGRFPIGAPFYFLPTVEVTDFFVEAFSLDNTLCDDTEIGFIQSANALVGAGVQNSFADEIPTCFDAAVRIAARVEQGMNINRILELVGRPVEVTSDGIWRYAFASEFANASGDNADPVPKIYFDVGEVTSTVPVDLDLVLGSSSVGNISQNYVVRGYTSNVNNCLSRI